MDKGHVTRTIIEGLISYGLFVLMTASESDVILAKAQLERTVAHRAQSIAAFFGRIAIHAETASNNTIQMVGK